MERIITRGLSLGICAVPVMAQSLKIGGGWTLPQGDYEDAVTSGWHGMAAFNFSAPASPLGIRVDGAYHLSPFDFPGDPDASSAIIAVGGDATYSIAAGGLSPYILGGVSWGTAKCTGDDCLSDASEDAWGYNFGGGVDIGMFFAEARYVWLGGDLEISFVPITVGLRF